MEEDSDDYYSRSLFWLDDSDDDYYPRSPSWLEDGDDYYPRSPFWIESSTDLHRASRRRRRASSIFFSSLVLLLLVAAILFLFFVIPSLFRHYSQNFKPNFVQRSWGRLNLVMVIFALAFGFLSKLRYEDRDYQRTGSSSSIAAPISTPRSPSPPPPQSPSPSPQPQVTSAPPVARKRTKPTHQSLAHNQGRKGDADLEPRKIVAEKAEDKPSAPPSATPVMATVQEAEQHNSRIRARRRRSGVNANKRFAAAFYIKNKKKWQKHPTVDTLDAQLHHPLLPLFQFQFPPLSPSSLPPPSPPPVFHNISTTKKDKHKEIPPTTSDAYSYTVPQPARPSSPPLFTDKMFTTKKENRKKIPPTIPVTNSYKAPLPTPLTTARESKPIIRKAPFTTSQKPPMPEKTHNSNIIEDWSSGTETNPPPPPLPPFEMKDLKYVVEGDFARLLSTDSSRNGSDVDEVESDETLNKASLPLFPPKPDVDTIAGSFISNFRAGLKLEKVNSYNKKQALKMSNLGPNPGSSSQF